jgi:sulfate adenylyltransferase subunit 2
MVRHAPTMTDVFLSGPQDPARMNSRPAHLKALEAESIYILREVAAQAVRPVLLYSIGKDSSVLLHLARKAFYPAKPPFPLLHIDTTWKFRDMIAFRDKTVKRFGFELRTHTNPEGQRQDINPFDHGSVYTQVMKTDALKQALTDGKYDLAIGGARRDEERSRAKERVFSVRGPGHTWEPKRQRPELWHLYNGSLAPGETLRVFPLSNWTELDIWTYILAEGIEVVPLYFAADRPTVMRDGQIIVVDDDRMRFEPGEIPETKLVRFRSLGCYPLSAAVDSPAATLEDIVTEMKNTRMSERAGRLIDQDQDASMETKKREGYF